MKKPLILVLLLVFILQAHAQLNTRWVQRHSYDSCIELSNTAVRVVLDPNVGGRVLEYTIDGRNVLYTNPNDDGKLWTPGEERIPVNAGRFDVGFNLPDHSALWCGKWNAVIAPSKVVTLTSPIDALIGVQLIRKFVLDADNSHLQCTQLIINKGTITRPLGHWSRTFALGNGIAIAPLNPFSRYPEQYATNGPKNMIIRFHNAPKNIEVINNRIIISAPPEYPKFFLDSYEGWLAYLATNDLLFIKTYETCADCPYGDEMASTASIWYFKDQMVEIEPMGTYLPVAPGDTVSFTENWFLMEYLFPANRKVKLDDIEQKVKTCFDIVGE